MVQHRRIDPIAEPHAGARIVVLSRCPPKRLNTGAFCVNCFSHRTRAGVLDLFRVDKGVTRNAQFAQGSGAKISRRQRLFRSTMNEAAPGADLAETATGAGWPFGFIR